MPSRRLYRRAQQVWSIEAAPPAGRERRASNFARGTVACATRALDDPPAVFVSRRRGNSRTDPCRNRSAAEGRERAGTDPALGALWRVPVKDLAADIRPEFLQFVAQAIVEKQKRKGRRISRSGPL